MKRKAIRYPTLSPDPIGDMLAACYRRLLTQVTQEEKSEHGRTLVANGELRLTGAVAGANTRGGISSRHTKAQ